jgi:hypothetical protein
MARREVTVERLSVEINELGDRGLSFRVQFTDGTDNFIIDVPRVILTQLQELIQEFGYSVSAEIEDDAGVRDLIAAKNYTINLQG